MPLGTGNDLARSLNWGGHFSRNAPRRSGSRCKKRGAEAVGRWACSVMPNAEGQRNKTVLHVPEVFSVHEYSAHVDEAETHTVVRKGRHHSARMTARVQDQLTGPRVPGVYSASVDEVEDSFDATVKETNLPISERRPSISQHVKPSETVLKLGGVAVLRRHVLELFQHWVGRGRRLCVPRGAPEESSAVLVEGQEPAAVRVAGHEGYRRVLRLPGAASSINRCDDGPLQGRGHVGGNKTPEEL